MVSSEPPKLARLSIVENAIKGMRIHVSIASEKARGESNSFPTALLDSQKYNISFLTSIWCLLDCVSCYKWNCLEVVPFSLIYCAWGSKLLIKKKEKKKLRRLHGRFLYIVFLSPLAWRGMCFCLMRRWLCSCNKNSFKC